MIYLGHYINGKFEFPIYKNTLSKTKIKFSNKKIFTFSKISSSKLPPAGKSHVSPANFKDIIFTWPKTIPYSNHLLFEVSEKAYFLWTQFSLKSRVRQLSPLKSIIQKKATDLAQTISRETGKPLWESKGEVTALINKTDFVLGPGLNRIRPKNIHKIKGRIRFKSRGTLVVIGPFNFPLHLPFGQILPALVAGNSVIFKPSEKTPLSGQKLAECFHNLNLPPGVFQMIQGGPKTAKKLYMHKKNSGVLFTGSFAVGTKIKKSLVNDYKKIIVLEMGGYNSTFIWDITNKTRLVSETLKACFYTAGQRCSSTSQIIIRKEISSKFIKDFVSEAAKIKPDHWSKNPFMGPVIDNHAIQRFLDFQNKVKKQKAKILLKGKHLKNKRGYYVTPGIYKMKWNKNFVLGKEETFTPQVILYEIDNLNEALEIINHSGYGLILSVWTRDKKVKKQIFHHARVGLINYNLSSIGASGLLPFGGLGKSGNNRPAGSYAIDFCVTPLAEKSFDGF